MYVGVTLVRYPRHVESQNKVEGSYRYSSAVNGLYDLQ